MKQHQLLEQIIAYVARSEELSGHKLSESRTRIVQSIDDKHIDIVTADLGEILLRSDTEDRDFIQVNFCSGHKILITESLIGFKPMPQTGLDIAKLPRVVTTPDILSVFEAIQETLHMMDVDPAELQVLRKIYEAVLSGGESVGFDLKAERAWISRIPVHGVHGRKASA